MKTLIDARLSELDNSISKAQEINPQLIRKAWRKLLKDFPDETQYLSNKMEALCNKHAIDFFEDIRLTGEEISDYVDKTAPDVEILN